ncbi:MAG: type IV pilus assembly protein PilM [Candidatus Brocadiales bacterium]
MLNLDLLSIQIGSKGPFLGLDMGNYSIKALKFGLTKSGPEIENLAEMEIPLEARKEGRDPKLMVEAVKTCLAKGSIVTKDVVIMVTGSYVFIRRITLPPMPQEEIEAVIPFEAAKFVPFPPEQAALDYIIVGKKEEEGVEKHDILVAATPKEAVEQEISIARAAGLKPVAVSVVPMTLWNTFQLTEAKAEEKIVALLDIGYKRSTICFFNKGVLEFTRTVNQGGNDVTESLMTMAMVDGEGGRRVLTYEEAEAVKLEYGFPSREGMGTTKDGIALTQVSMLMRPGLEKLLGEIRMSFNFYTTEFQVPEVDKCIISGGGAALKGLKDFLASELGMEVELINPFRGILFEEGVSEGDVEEAAPAFVAALGLAAWETGDLSLLPRKRLKKERSLIGAYVTLGIITALVIGYLYWEVRSAKVGYTVELGKKMTQLAELTQMSSKASKLSTRRKALIAAMSAFPPELRKSVDCAKVIRELRLSLPNNVRLEEVEISPETNIGWEKIMKVRGVAFPAEEEGPTVSILMAALKNSPLFDDVRLLYLEGNKDYTTEGSRFQLFCRCNPIGD